MAAGMAVPARVSAASAAAAPAASAATASPPTAVAGRITISLGRFARLTRFMRVPGIARLARALRPAGDLIRRPVKAADHLAKRLDLALVGGFLALGFLDEFEQFVHRLRRVAQSAERLFHFLERLADAGWRRGLGWRWRRLRTRFAVAVRRRRRAPLARWTTVGLGCGFLESFRGRFSRGHFLRSGSEERLVFGAAHFGGGDFSASPGGRFGGDIGRVSFSCFGSRLRAGFCGGRMSLFARAGAAYAHASAATAATATRA